VEHDNFDRLVRLIGAARTRREALRLAAAGALVGGIATREGAAAKHRRRKSVRAQQNEVPACTNRCRICDKKIGPGTNLSGCSFNAATIIRPNLGGSNLSGACFVGADLGVGNFRGVNASNACFQNAELGLADFRSANVSGANFCGADLRGANFLGSNITQAQLDCATVGCDTIKPNGKPAVQCDPDQVCCTAVCCDPDSCINNTCVEPPAP
jgi:uncharacterized protein YjbI with pentapeptide repeats